MPELTSYTIICGMDCAKLVAGICVLASIAYHGVIMSSAAAAEPTEPAKGVCEITYGKQRCDIYMISYITLGLY